MHGTSQYNYLLIYHANQLLMSLDILFPMHNMVLPQLDNKKTDFLAVDFV